MTLCRSEVNKIPSAGLNKLGQGFTPSDVKPSFVDDWMEIINQSSYKKSIRDRVADRPKSYTREWARKSIGQHILRRNRLRNALGLIYPPIRGNEWSLPRWYLNSHQPDKVLEIYKILHHPYWMTTLLNSQVPVKIIHNIRKPYGYLASWYRRYLNSNSPEDVRDTNINILSRVREEDDHWSNRLENLEAMDILETEMLLWIHSNETIYLQGKDKENYLLTYYEDVDKDGKRFSKELYDFVGLDWTPEIGNEVVNMENKLFKKSARINDDIDNKINQVIDRYLPESCMSEFWE